MEIRRKRVVPKHGKLNICIMSHKLKVDGTIIDTHPEKHPIWFYINPVHLRKSYPINIENSNAFLDQKRNLHNLLVYVGRIYAKRNKGEFMDCRCQPPEIIVWFDFDAIAYNIQFRFVYEGKIWVNHIVICQILTQMKTAHYWLEDLSDSPKFKIEDLDMEKAADELLWTKTQYEKRQLKKRR